MDFLCPAGKRPMRLQRKILQEMSERRRIRFTFPKIFKDAMGHGKTVR
jgi:hypothetical protein